MAADKVDTAYHLEGQSNPSPPSNERDIGHDLKADGIVISDIPDPDAGATDEERAAIDKKLVRQLDIKLIPWLTFLYLVSFLDRTNIGNAKIDGMLTDLGGDPKTASQKYNLGLTLFFISYAGFEPLTNVLLKRMRPSIFIPVIMVLWGICTTCLGLIHNYPGLYAARWFLGVAEAGLFPGINFFMSCWYKRSEFGIRAAIFFSAAAVAGSFGGLLAAAIAQMDGVGGKPGWAWIFILEGLITVVIGFVSFFLVHDFPDQARFLSVDDRHRVLRRLAADGQKSAKHEKFQAKYLVAAFKDWKTYAFAIIYMGCDGPLYAFSLFLPTIIKGLGYKNTTANLLSVPPYAAAAILTITIGWYADKTNRRGLCNIAASILGVVGFCMQIGSQNLAVKYAGTFFGALGIYPCIANTIAWCANNVEGVYKRGVVLGLVIGWGNLNGIMSSNVYRTQDSPKFYLGHGVILGYLAVFLFGFSVLTHFLLSRENKKRLAGKRDHLVVGKSEEEIEDMGDQKPSFIYTT